MNIYVLNCKNNKYYIGKTDDLGKRLQEHFTELDRQANQYGLLKTADGARKVQLIKDWMTAHPAISSHVGDIEFLPEAEWNKVTGSHRWLKNTNFVLGEAG